jgi:tetratricopeptide (TPR) repeat protein
MPILITILTAGLFALGCGGESITEKARRAADPNALALLVEAQEYFDIGFYNYALILADSAAGYAPELADIPFLRGRILGTMRQFDHATAAYERTVDLDPGYSGVFMNLGNLEYLRGEPLAALRHYRKETGDAKRSLDYKIQLGRAYADLGEVDSARWAYQEAIEINDADPTAFMWMGQLLEDQGSLDEALEYSRKGLALNPDNLNYEYIVGVLLMRKGELEGAVDILRRVVVGMPWHYAAHYNLGQALTGLGEFEEGAAYLARSDTLHDHLRGIARWESLLASNNHEPMLWVNYGNSLREVGRVDDAIHALSIASSLEPEWLEIQNNIGNLLLARGDTLEALNRYRGLIEIDSTLTDIWLNIGTVHALSSDYDEARRAWETALDYEPGHPEAIRYLAQLPPP